ncbi:MAG: hypothetical protein KDK62_02920 [Chlamydiia bacterium]|nr:hypothetical protein [Chlamydiia bacterium]
MQSNFITLGAACKIGISRWNELELKAPDLKSSVTLKTPCHFSCRALNFSINGQPFWGCKVPLSKIRDLWIECQELSWESPFKSELYTPKARSIKVPIDVSGIVDFVAGSVYTLWIESKGNQLTASVKMLSGNEACLVRTCLFNLFKDPLENALPIPLEELISKKGQIVLRIQTAINEWAQKLPQPLMLVLKRGMFTNKPDWQMDIYKLLPDSYLAKLMESLLKLIFKDLGAEQVDLIACRFIEGIRFQKPKVFCAGTYRETPL